MLSDRPRKVAIVGAGPSGTSAAYWLSKAQEQLDLTGQGHHGFHIHIYEKETRIGGRAKIVHPYGDEKRYQAVELGASIFADVNRNMVRLAKVRRPAEISKLSLSANLLTMTAIDTQAADQREAQRRRLHCRHLGRLAICHRGE